MKDDLSMINIIVYNVMDATSGSIKNLLALLRNNTNHYRKKGKVSLGIVGYVERVCFHILI